jgi:thimet oligopeptidase
VAGLRNTEVANDYRRKVLQAAGSKPASDFVADFLGREFSTDAYIKSLQDDG